MNGSSPQFAGFWLRVVAYLIDWLVLAIPMFILGFIVAMLTGGMSAPQPEETGGAASSVINLLSLLIGWVYFANMESSSYQASLGKMALGLKVTDVGGDRISFGRATGRFFGKILSGLILMIGYIMVAFTPKKQGLHDMMAETLVVRT